MQTLKHVTTLLLIAFVLLSVYCAGANSKEATVQPGHIITYSELRKLGDDNYLVEVYTRSGAHVLKMNRKELSKLHRIMN